MNDALLLSLLLTPLLLLLLTLLLDDMSMLRTEGGFLDAVFEEPRVGGRGGREAVDGDVKLVVIGLEVFRIEPERREGGGGGVRPLSDRGRVISGPITVDMADFPLSDRGRVFSIPMVDMLGLGISSSTFGDSRPDPLRLSLDSETIWLCRRVSGGAGGVLRFRDEEGEGGSGVLPAASLSKTDSRSESWLVRFGAGGRGLLRSVCELEVR
jgi:hypothetical protein